MERRHAAHWAERLREAGLEVPGPRGPGLRTRDPVPGGGGDTPQARIERREGWHRGDRSGALRAGIFGVSDGLVSNTALVMGFAGSGASRHTVLLAAMASLLAFAMGAVLVVLPYLVTGGMAAGVTFVAGLLIGGAPDRWSRSRVTDLARGQVVGPPGAGRTCRRGRIRAGHRWGAATPPRSLFTLLTGGDRDDRRVVRKPGD